MREIKFRAWHKEKKILREVLEISFSGRYVILAGFGSFGEIEAPIRDVELMQYTSVNDKRGVEIYEGDIVKFESSVPIPEGPDYPKEGQMGVIEYGFCDYYVDTKSPCRFNLDELGDWIVVGNIYENPELLKGR